MLKNTGIIIKTGLFQNCAGSLTVFVKKTCEIEKIIM
jgi:hypothetical protein